VVPVPKEGEIAGILTAVRNLLDAGEESAALTEIERVLAFDAQNKTATSLVRQIREDPAALYGRESFAYRVQSGDTLASIAQRYMNDRDQFYGLARYNGIEVPRQLPVGQMIRIPGKQPRVPPPPAPAPAPATPPPPPPAAPVAPAPPPAPVAQPQPQPDPLVESARRERERKAAVTRWTRTARTAMARQDVCGAIAAWNQVLSIDPDNRTAVLEREKALELKKRLPSAKC
jgi:murein DD-endopeptidase MepM/ murein hydrolase activator NlpD